MKIGMIGLGKMGGNMVICFKNGGQDVVGFDCSQEVIDYFVLQGVVVDVLMSDMDCFIELFGEFGQ